MSNLLYPVFQTFGKSGSIKNDSSPAAKKLKNANETNSEAKDLTKLSTTSVEIALKRAEARVKRLRGDPSDDKELLGQMIMEVGPYRGNTFVWLLSNDLGYTLYVWRDFEKRNESVSAFGSHNPNVAANFKQLVMYMRLFPRLLDIHRADGQRQASKCKCFPSAPSTTVVPPQDSASSSTACPPEASRSSSTILSQAPETSSTTSNVRRWSKQVSPAQESWMISQLESNNWIPSAKMVEGNHSQLWHLPSPGQLVVRKPGQLPNPSDFWLHPMFVWMPDKFLHLFPSGQLPCLNCKTSGGVSRKQLGEPRVVVGSGGGVLDMGQYFIVSIYLKCKRCQVSPWRADLPAYLEKLPDVVRELFPAHVTYRKRVCRSVLDRLMRPGRSPADVASEVRDLLKLRYERAHLAYLQTVSLVKAASSLDGQFGLVRSTPAPAFGDYEDPEGWNGVEVSQEFMVGCLVTLYQEQRPYLYGLMKGTFGRFLKSDHTRTFAKRAEKLSGAMWSYSCCNEFQEIVSWVLVGGAGETELKPLYEGLRNRFTTSQVPFPSVRWVDRDCCNLQTTTPRVSSLNPEDSGTSSVLPAVRVLSRSVDAPDTSLTIDELKDFRTAFCYPSSCRLYFVEDIVELLDPFHCMRRLGRACVSEAHPLFGKFMSLLSGAFFIVDESDLDKLRAAVQCVGLDSPTKDQIRRHCRLVIPPARQLYARVESVMNEFWRLDSFSPPSSVPLFDDRMKEEWAVQGLHMKRACLSDPVAPADGDHPAGIAYRIVKHEFLRASPKPEARLPVYQTVRGTSQLEGFHPHQAKWVTGKRVSPALFQAQGMFGVVKWNYQRAIDHRKLKLPAVFNPKLHAQTNALHKKEYGCPKYPDLVFNTNETDELFGVEFMAWEHIRAEMAMVTGDSESSSSVVPSTVDVCPDTGETDIVNLENLDLESISSVGELVSNQNRKAGPSTPPDSLSRGPSPAPSSGSSTPVKVSAKLALRKAMQAGVEARPIPHDHWPLDTKNLVDSLLSQYSGKDKMKLVLHEYLQRVRTGRSDLSLELVSINMNFLRAYERRVNREMAQKQAIVMGGGHFSIPLLESKLRKPADLCDQFTTVDVPSTPAEPLPGFSGCIEFDLPESASSRKRKSDSVVVSEDPPGPSAPGPFALMPPPLRKREKKNEKSGTNLDGRNCLHCGQPMSKDASWHRKEIRKGQPCLFFCPQQMMNMYELDKEPYNLCEPPTLGQFKSLKVGDLPSPYERHLESLRVKKDQETAAKLARAAERERKGQKTPGVSKGSRLSVKDRK